jgi:hypothetical protein
MHYLRSYQKKFKEDANLNTAFNMQNERNLLYDLGLININYGLGIDVKFMRDYEVFKIPVTDKNKVIIKGKDLYNCGYWLEKQKNGSFICENCGNEFAYSGKLKKHKTGRPRKYCLECQEIMVEKQKHEAYLKAKESSKTE